MTLRLPKFRYVGARSLDEAVGTLADHGPKAMLVAGGTDLFPNMKRRMFSPEVVVGLRGVSQLYGIGSQAPFTIGACVTLTDVAASPAIRESFPALAEAASLVSTPQLRNMGTIGGNICLDTRRNYYDQSAFWRKALGYCMKLDGDICRVALASPRCLATFCADTDPAVIG